MDNNENQKAVIELSFQNSFEPQVLQLDEELAKDTEKIGGAIIGMLSDILKEMISDVLGDDYDLNSVIRIAAQNASNFAHMYDMYKFFGGKYMDQNQSEIIPTINSIIMQDEEGNYVFGFAADDDEVQISYLFSALAVTSAKLLNPDELDSVLGFLVASIVDDLFEEDDDEEEDDIPDLV